MLVDKTWPNYSGIDKDGVSEIIDQSGYSSDVKYGRTKLFIRTPKTVFELEKIRAEILPTLVRFLQRVREQLLTLNSRRSELGELEELKGFTTVVIQSECCARLVRTPVTQNNTSSVLLSNVSNESD